VCHFVYFPLLLIGSDVNHISFLSHRTNIRSSKPLAGTCVQEITAVMKHTPHVAEL
jgi:hypothetical protein